MVIKIDSTDPNESVSTIVFAQKLDNKTILSAMAESVYEGRLNTRDAIAGTIAELLLQENRTEEAPLVLPTTSIIERTIKPSETQTVPPDTLVGLMIKLKETDNRLEQAKLGVELGDKAILMHSGFVGSRKLGDNNKTRFYSHGMGVSGYEQAIIHYSMYPTTQGYSDALKVTVSNFERISRIIRSLHENGIKPLATN